MVERVDETVWNLVEGILASGVRLALATTGGGIQLAAWLLDHPGASQAVVEVQVPYHPEALGDFLGAPGPHRVEAGTALQLAGRAFRRVQRLGGGTGWPIGVGCTAALATRRVRRGEDRAFLALRLEGEYRVFALRFVKGKADRLEQEEGLSRIGLQALARACGVAVPEEMRPEYVELEVRAVSLEDPLGLVIRGDLPVVEVDAAGRASAEVERRGRLLLPGSFNPLHPGHGALAAAAEKQSGKPVCLEISVANVDKPPLARSELEARIAQFRGRFPVVVTRAATFVEKARLFGDCTFAIGFDTVVRLFEARYYEEGEAGMARALEEMGRAGCRFLVAGRRQGERYGTLDDLELPAAHQGMFTAIPEAAFRMDISSTEIRRRGEKETR